MLNFKSVITSHFSSCDNVENNSNNDHESEDQINLF